MSLEDLGNIGELISAVAVVVSLVYLASQIRQNTRQIDENTRAAQAAAFDSSISHAFVARQSSPNPRWEILSNLVDRPAPAERRRVGGGA